MLVELNVKNIALIDKVSVEFGEGLNILTGETGAGKSVIIDAVMLALGARVRSDIIRTGSDSAYVELVFDVNDPRKLEKLRTLSVEPDEGGLIYVTRRLTPGRSQSRINDENVSLSRLREVSGELIDIYGQNEYHTLLDSHKQLEVLDAFMGEDTLKLRTDTREAYRDFEEAKARYRGFDMDEAMRAREEDILSYELSEIDTGRLREGEEEELSREYKKLCNMKSITGHLSTAYDELKHFDASLAAGEIGEALKYDEELRSIYDEVLDMESVSASLIRSISDYAEENGADEERLRTVEGRLDEIHALEAKYGRTVADVYAYRESISERLSALGDYEAARLRTERELKEAEDRLMSLSAELSGRRKEGAVRLADSIGGELRDLAFTEAGIAIELHEAAPTADGIDEVVLMARLNPGEPMKPLSMIASGGELSRVMLAIKTVLARTDDMPTLIFDEIDAGISGRTAQKVAEKMADISRDHQLIAVSHLPQIAAMADRHYAIVKEESLGRNITRIERLDKDGEIRELSRLLGGAEITDAVSGNAREIKGFADIYKKGTQ